MFKVDIEAGKKMFYVFDSFMHPKASDFFAFLSATLCPPEYIITIESLRDSLIARYKKKNEIEGDVGEE
jgi:hypothetical protein